MQYNRVFRILALALIFSLLMLAIPATPALAAPAITLTPASGPPATPIIVTGTGFTTGTGEVWFDTNNNNVRDSGEPYVSAVADGSGNLSAASTLAVPTVPRTTSPYQVRADVPSGGTIPDASSPFTVTPQITLSASSGYVGDTVTASGNGFAASSSLTILFDTTSIGTTTATATGTFTGFSLTVPESTKGSHTIKAQETSTPANYATATFTVSPKVTVTPASGSVGDTVTINGTGFAASSSLTIYFDTTSVGAATTNANGSFINTTFTIPSTSRGGHTIKAQDASSNYATATFAVAHKVTITPTSGAPGITVTVNGSGFGASKPVTIKYNAAVVTTTPATINTDATGSFTASFTVPAGLAGTYAVEATDGTNSASANFTITINITLSKTTSEASPGYVGMVMTISGTGFKPNSQINITYTSTPIVVATIASNTEGAFSVTFEIPTSEHGTHTITASDGTNTLQATFVMESEAPLAPKPLLPPTGEKAKSKAIFDWEDVTKDVNGADEKSKPVTYDLQIASDADFTNMLVEQTGLTTSGYTLTEAEKLESTKKEEPYYWRIRAVDAAFNASDWTIPGTFYVGFTFPELKGWVLYGLIGAGVLLLFFLGFWAGRKSKRSEYY